jgi:hypothetical protein
MGDQKILFCLSEDCGAVVCALFFLVGEILVRRMFSRVMVAFSTWLHAELVAHRKGR